jgi:hypothetical protein
VAIVDSNAVQGGQPLIRSAVAEISTA